MGGREVKTMVELLGPVMTAVGLPLMVGFKYLRENAAPRRVVWIPGEDVLSPPAQREPTAKTVADCASGFDVAVWGKSVDDARELRRLVLVAVAEVHGYDAVASATAARWILEAEDGSLIDGAICTVRITIAETIDADTNATATTVEGEELDAADTANGDGVLGVVDPPAP